MAQGPEVLGRRPNVKPHANNGRRATVPFPLTPALFLGERENPIPSRDEWEGAECLRARMMGLPLLGKTLGVRGNGSPFNPKCRTFAGTVKLQESCGRAGGFPPGPKTLSASGAFARQTPWSRDVLPHAAGKVRSRKPSPSCLPTRVRGSGEGRGQIVWNLNGTCLEIVWNCNGAHREQHACTALAPRLQRLAALQPRPFTARRNLQRCAAWGHAAYRNHAPL